MRSQTPAPNETACTSAGAESDPILLGLPSEVLEYILHKLDAISLAQVNQCCRILHMYDKSSGLRLTEKVAQQKVIALCGSELATRWRNLSWLERLYIENSVVGFDRQRCLAQGFLFSDDPGTRKLTHLKLDGMGPKLLVSDLSTQDQPILRWRLCVKGNTAVEFGVVPVELQDHAKALHKCHSTPNNERPAGFCSSITVGSQLPIKVPVMKGSVVEVVARRGRVEFLITNPPDGQELYWHNTRTMPKPYKGPLEFRLEQDFPDTYDIKLALTSWALGAFDVLHPTSGQIEVVLPANSCSQTACANNAQGCSNLEEAKHIPDGLPTDMSDASSTTQ